MTFYVSSYEQLAVLASGNLIRWFRELLC